MDDGTMHSINIFRQDRARVCAGWGRRGGGGDTRLTRTWKMPKTKIDRLMPMRASLLGGWRL